MLRSSPHPNDGRSGFALLITITLLAFLVLLLVSLAALTRVETQVASNNQQLSQARQHALMGLNVALGRLQSLAGPDRRITATADIIPGVHDDKRRWTGVWNTTGASPSPDWLVSSATPASVTGTAPVATALPPTGTVPLVSSSTVDTSSAGNAVTVETQTIASDGVPGLTGPQTVGSFAYWVGDEGVKARVDLVDPGAAENATQADEIHSFINAQRFGIEGVDANAPGTPLSAYPANDAGILPKVMDLKQLPLANPSATATLSTAVKTRFHDLTTTSSSVLADVVNGGLKKDLTAWIADPAAPSNPVSTAAADDYIAPGDPADTGKYGLPKWELIRSYATTYSGHDATPLAVAPRLQTDSVQGISPIMTYARMGYNLSMDSAGNLHVNVMPVVALWNPYNVPLEASTDNSNTYEFCVKFKPQITATTTYDRGGHIKLWFSDAALRAEGADAFMLPTIQMWTSVGTPVFKSYAEGPTPVTSTTAGTVPVYWRFKLKLSRRLDPGESRLFTIHDNFNEQQYHAGVSEMTDQDLGVNNAVYIPSNVPLTPAQRADPETHIFWQTEPARIYIVMTEFALTKPGLASDQLRSDNAYHKILGNGFEWNTDPNPFMTLGEIPPIGTNTGVALNYQRVQLVMSENPTEPGGTNNGVNTSGTPRWLALLNPQAPVALRKPLVAVAPSVNPKFDFRAMTNPSYQNETFVKYPAIRAYHEIPSASGTDVSAGTQVSTLGTPQDVVLRELQPDPTTLISLGQLQHMNASLINLNPAHPVGNSLANLYVPPAATQSDPLVNDTYIPYSTASPPMDNTYPGFPSSAQFQRIYDLSYLLNKALWDGYFFSTVPHAVAPTGTFAGQSALTAAQAAAPGFHLPNARHRFHWRAGNANEDEIAGLLTTTKAAAHLLVSGGFNVNSTSEQAWRALLHSHNGVATDPSDATKKHPYSRLAVPVDPAQPNTTWPGYRILSDAQINALAQAIVAEVRNRGPFLSLADFVNRRLTDDATGLKGPFQAAIDATTTGAASINGGAPFDFNSMPVTGYPLDIPSTDTEQRTVYLGGADATHPSASRANVAPGYLTQADLLSALGPSLTARSDTFRIRAYGDVLNPVTGSATPEARAWCEAIVQRLPDYVDSSMPAETDLASAPASTAKTTNQTFGRRFKLVSFRWLSTNDI